MSTASFQTTCCIVGGGPAGVMLGYLLARAGVKVTILEKHQDFFRDFRGDTVHPSTLELLHELGLLGKFLKQPHQKVTSVGVKFGDFTFEVANFRQLQTYCRFALIMPQWDFLNFLSEQAKKYSTFDLRMQHEAIDLLYQGERIRGVMVRTPGGTEQIVADLVVACDGRHSVMRMTAQLPLRQLGVPIDVLWFRIGRREDDREQVLGNIDFGKMLVLINRNDYFQAGLIIRKNSFEEIKERGLESLRKDISQIAPFLSERVGELKDWAQIQLLSVQINRLKRWHRPGLLCIGDAAHAMSPVFGIGINLAIQDAVAAANLLARPLREGGNTDHLLHEVQRRREFRTRLTQALQVFAHTGFQYVFRRQGPLHAPWPLRLVARAHVLQPILLRVVGIGAVPEHVGPAAAPRRRIANRVAILTGMGAGIAAAAVVGWRGLRGGLHAATQRS
jgi:2-polyprenyl-6-methoxyphenol hydroxylase-like FAD-dependent oxidoreductase